MVKFLFFLEYLFKLILIKKLQKNYNFQYIRSIFLKRPNCKSKNNFVYKELFFKSPKSICEMVKDESKSNCFVILLNKEKEIIDVVSGQINHSSISEVISLNQKHYFHKNIKKENELSLIPKDLNDINLYLKIENKDYLIKN